MFLVWFPSVFHLQLNAANVFMERVKTGGDKWASCPHTPLKRSKEKFVHLFSIMYQDKCIQFCCRQQIPNLFRAANRKFNFILADDFPAETLVVSRSLIEG